MFFTPILKIPRFFPRVNVFVIVACYIVNNAIFSPIRVFINITALHGQNFYVTFARFKGVNVITWPKKIVFGQVLF